MKKLLSIIFIFSVLTTLAQQQLPNPDFENWSDTHNADGWNILEVGTSPFLYYSAVQTNDAAYESSAVKLETQSILGQIMPGLILLGEINMETYMPEGGIEFTNRPTGISFHYKYAPAPNDSSLMFLILTKWNSDTNTRDTIAGTFFTQSEEIIEYTKKTLPIFYQSIDAPDTINIIFVSSGETPVVGSTFYVDFVTMEYGLLNYATMCLPATNTDTQSFTANWLPIPNATSYYLDVATDENFTNYLPDYENKALPYSEVSYIISDIEPNLYYYRVRVGYNLSDVSENSNPIKIAMTTEALEASNTTSNSFLANWQEVATATSYTIEVATDNLFENIITTKTALESGYEITELNSETEYFYRIKVVYNEGNDISKNSNTISVTTDTETLTSEINNNNFNIFTKNGTIIIENKNIQNTNVSIYNYTGKLFAKINLTNTTTKIPVNQTGIYIINIKTNEQNITKKVFVN